VVGLSWHVLLYEATNVHAVIPALLIALSTFFLVSLFTKKPPREVLELLG